MKVKPRTYTNQHMKEYSARVTRGKYNNVFVMSLILTVYKPTWETIDPRNTFVLKSSDSVMFSLPLVTLRIIHR